MKHLKNHYSAILFFLAFLFTGFILFKDFGIATDEWNNRLNGAVSFKYIYSLIDRTAAEKDPVLLNIPSLENYYDKDYPVLFDLPLFFIEWKLKLTGTPSSVYLRHGFIFLLFFLASFFFYLLLFKRFENQYLALIGTLFLVLTPRIFAHGFFNIKDHAFLSVFIIGTYFLHRFLQRPSTRNTVCFAVACAIAINTRILGVFLPFSNLVSLAFVYIAGVQQNFSFNEILRKCVFAFVIMGLVIFGTWPYLWTNPIINFLKAFKHMVRFRWTGNVDYFGESIKASELPWHYIPVWMAITIPVLYIAFFIVGLYKLLLNIVKAKFRIATKTELLDHLMLFLFFSPLLVVIISKSVMYGDWRHMYFIYAPFLYISVVGVSFFFRLGKKYKALKYGLIVATFLHSFGIMYWMCSNHPYEHLYFNQLVSQKACKNFTSDYWLLTNRRSFEFVTSMEKDSCFIVSTRYDNLFQCYQFLKTKADTNKYKMLLFKSPQEITDNLLDSLTKKRRAYLLDNSAISLTNSKSFYLQKIHSEGIKNESVTSVFSIKSVVN